MASRRRVLLVSVVSIVASGSIATSCGDDPDSNIPTVANWSTTIEWHACLDSLECGSLIVPFDYSNPSLGTFELPVIRHRASDPNRRIGVLLVNPGGPGGSGVDFVSYVESWASPQLLDRFDIVGWDPRGVGGSKPAIDCIDDVYDYFALDPTPDSREESRRLLDGAAEFASQCEARSGDFLPYVDTVRAASDIDVLRRALDEETITYFGFSYGTKLGSTWISLFPDTVRAAVLDAAIDPTLGYVDDLVLQASGFETSLNTFFRDCDAKGCPFTHAGETAADAFDRLSDSLDAEPIPNGGTTPPTNQGILGTAVVTSLYGDRGWPGLSDALTAVDTGDGLPLLMLFDSYFGVFDGVPDNSIDAYFGVTCADRGLHVDEGSVLASKTRLAEVAPRLGGVWIQEMLVCANWDARPARAFDIGADTAVRTVVVGSFGDAATPFSGAINLTQVLGDTRLIISKLEQHTTYGSDPCVTEAVDNYLVDLVEGPDVLEC